MTQQTIGQRLKFLMDELNLKVRTFASAIDVSETNVRNYLSRDSKPSSDILERIVLHYPSVNSHWLLTGKGEPFLPRIPELPDTQQANIKNNSGIGISTGGSPIINNLNLEGCRRELESTQKENESLRQRLQLTEALLASKEETITLLRGSFTRPN